MSAPAHKVEIEPFDLRKRVLEIVETSDTADPHQIADEVLARISTRDAPAALGQCLPDYVRLVVSNLGKRPYLRKGQPVQQKSWKLEGAKLLVERTLKRRMFIDGAWKLLAECTREDVLFAAESRRKQADELAAAAAWYDALAERMDKTSAQTVADVPEAELLQLVTNAEVTQ